MVISHSCDLDKEFNREYERLINEEGASPEDAQEVASLDASLDPILVVSPLLPYDEAPEDQHAGIKSGQRIGYLPIPPHRAFDKEELFVDLRRLSAIDRLFAKRYPTVLSLADSAAGVLRFKISEMYSSRGLAVMAEIEALAGAKITHVETLPKTSKATMLALHLESGEIVHLEIRRPATPEVGRPAVSRTWRP